MTEIELADGTVLEAPDGLNPAQIKAIVQKHSGGPKGDPGILNKAARWVAHQAAKQPGDEPGFFSQLVGAELPKERQGESPLETVGRQGLKAASFMVPAGRLAGLSALGKAAKVGVAGAGSAALGSLAEGDLSSPEKAAETALSGARLGGGINTGLSLLGSGVGKLAQVAQPKLKDLAWRMGNKAVKGFASISVKQKIPEQAIEQAYATGVIKPGMEVGDIYKAAEKAVDSLGQELTNTVKGLEQAGVTGPNGFRVANDWLQQVQHMRPSFSQEKQVLTHWARKIEAVADQYPTGDIPLSVWMGLKRDLQNAAHGTWTKLRGDISPGGKLKKMIAQRMRMEEDAAVRAQRNLAPDLVDRFFPAKENLSNMLKVRYASETGDARAWARHLPIYSSLAGAYVGGQEGGPKGAVAGALLPVAVARSPSTIGAASRAAARYGAKVKPRDLAAVPPQVAALIQYLRGPQEDSDAP